MDMDFIVLSQLRPAGTASCPVSVRLVTVLLHASLESCLATTLMRSTHKKPHVIVGLTVDLCLYSDTGECVIVNRFRVIGFQLF